jgi:hypothetical protein
MNIAHVGSLEESAHGNRTCLRELSKERWIEAFEDDGLFAKSGLIPRASPLANPANYESD